MNADLEEAGHDGLRAVVELFDGFVVNITINTGDSLTFVFAESFKKVFGLLDGLFHVGRAVIWDDDEEGFIHNISFARKLFDEIDIIIH